ncbi:MAG TPA: hypothetical protein VK503_01695 [Candidatus Bathyarchaeia archaeon]|nr:hypothetical protein [Candidatus Bathyarchaeia archaeon]
MVNLRDSLWVKVAVVILVLAAGFTLVSGQFDQAYAAGHWSGGYHGGWNRGWWYRGGWYGWYAPGYPVYPCPVGFVWNPYVYPYCFRAP